MNKISHVKCPNCGEFNTNKEYCSFCDVLLSFEKKEADRKAYVHNEEVADVIEKLEEQNFIDRLKKNPFILIRVFGWMLHSVWIVLNIIGGLIAWFVAMVAAG